MNWSAVTAVLHAVLNISAHAATDITVSYVCKSRLLQHSVMLLWTMFEVFWVRAMSSAALLTSILLLQFDYPFKRGSSSGSTSFSFVTQVQDYTSLQQELITKLHTTAASAPPLAVNGNEERGAAAAKPKQRQRRKWSQPDSQSYAETEIDTLADLDFAGPKGADLDGTGNGSSVDGRRSSSTGRATKRTKKLNL